MVQLGGTSLGVYSGVTIGKVRLSGWGSLGPKGSLCRGPKGPYVEPAWVVPERHHPSLVAKSRAQTQQAQSLGKHVVTIPRAGLGDAQR